MDWQLAQCNVARWAVDPEGVAARGFRRRVDVVHALADAADGFVWRLPSDAVTEAASAAAFGVGWLVNVTVWRDVEALRAFTFASDHAAVLRQRRRWFAAAEAPTAVLWWVPTGHRPDQVEAAARLDRLRCDGPSSTAFTMATAAPPPSTDPLRAGTP